MSALKEHSGEHPAQRAAGLCPTTTQFSSTTPSVRRRGKQSQIHQTAPREGKLCSSGARAKSPPKLVHNLFLKIMQITPKQLFHWRECY